MFFGKKETGFGTQPSVNMVNPQGMMDNVQGPGMDMQMGTMQMPGMDMQMGTMQMPGMDMQMGTLQTPGMDMQMGTMQLPGMMDGMQGPMMGGMPTPGMPYEGFGQYPADGLFPGSQPQMGCCCEPCIEQTEVDIEKKQPQVYVVKKGDTVYKIAKRFGLDWRELAGYNHLGNPNLIYPGERLFIPRY